MEAENTADDAVDGTVQPGQQDDVDDSEEGTVKSKHRNPSKRSPASLPGLRQRLTLVCAECKRLKLRCDRRTPCENCRKRNTVSLCTYSDAAREKIDLTSVNNKAISLDERLTALEDRFGQSSGDRGDSVGEPGIQDSGSIMLGYRKIISTDDNASFISVRLDELTSLWLNNLEIASPSEGPQLALILPQSQERSPRHRRNSRQFWKLHIDLFYPSSSDGENGRDDAHVTRELLAKLPSGQTLQVILGNLEESFMAGRFPCLHFKTFRERIERMIRWAEHFEGRSGSLSSSRKGKAVASHESLAFFAAASAALSLGARLALAEQAFEDHDNPRMYYPVDGRSNSSSEADSSRCGALQSNLGLPLDLPDELLGLSEIAVQLCRQGGYQQLNCDFVHALVLQAYSHLTSPQHEGENAESSPSRKGKRVKTDRPQQHCPLAFGSSLGLSGIIGALIGDAREIGLDVDPDDISCQLSLLEKENRRRLWWEIVMLDRSLSERSGQPSLITEDLFSTRLPSIIHDDKFDSNSSVLPVAEPDVLSPIGFFVAKCRLSSLCYRRATYEGHEDPASVKKVTKEISDWYHSQPASYRFTQKQLVDLQKQSHPPLDDAHSSDLRSRCFLSQKLELGMWTQGCIFRLLTPSLKDIERNKPRERAECLSEEDTTKFRAVHPALSVIRAAKFSQTTLQSPSLALSYRSLVMCFEAGVSLANMYMSTDGIFRPSAALEGVRLAIEVLKSSANGDDDFLASPIDILEAVLLKARSIVSVEEAGSKRKAEDPDIVHLDSVRLPFVSPAILVKSSRISDVPSAGPAPPSSGVSSSTQPDANPADRPELSSEVQSVDTIDDGPLTTKPRVARTTRITVRERKGRTKKPVIGRARSSSTIHESTTHQSPRSSSAVEGQSFSSSSTSPNTAFPQADPPPPPPSTATGYSTDSYLSHSHSAMPMVPTFGPPANPAYNPPVAFDASYSHLTPQIQQQVPSTSQQQYPLPPDQSYYGPQGVQQQQPIYGAMPTTQAPRPYAFPAQNTMDTFRQEYDASHTNPMQSLMIGTRRDSRAGSIAESHYESPVETPTVNGQEPHVQQYQRQSQMGQESQQAPYYFWSGQ